jgi:dUTP pyrophosphatase
MFENIKNMKDQMKMVKDLKNMMGDIDTSNPSAMFEKLGLNTDELESHFMESMERKVPLSYTNINGNKAPEYAFPSDSGFDLTSIEDIWIFAGDRKLVPTGLRFDIPDGYEIQVRSKSGLALNQGLMVLNSPGTVDSGYNGEVKVILFNTSNQNVKLEKGQKIAQAVLCPVVNGKWVNLIKVDDIDEKDRNDNGFGSTNLF